MRSQIARAEGYITRAEEVLNRKVEATLTAETVKAWQDVSRLLQLAAECGGSEPPPRAMNCGLPNIKDYA